MVKGVLMTQTIDQAKAEQFMGKALEDSAGMTATLFAMIGEKLGLYRALADQPATSAELSARTGIDERYALEWLRGQVAAGYLTHDPDTEQYTLPPDHAPVLVNEAGPMFFGGIYQMQLGFLGVVPSLLEAFREGGGVPQSAYNGDTWQGMERFTEAWFANLMIPDWLPAIPDVERQLESGATLADVGCGAGRALFRLAERYPRSKFVGYDAFEGQLNRAEENAKSYGVADRVRFAQRDVARDGLPEKYDIITTFDVIHDSADPVGLMRAIGQSLKSDGSYLMLEINSADNPADNVGPLATFLYGASVLYCMTTSLAQNGAGLGTLGMPEPKVRELGAEAGFGQIVRAPITDNPFNVLYQLKR